MEKMPVALPDALPLIQRVPTVINVILKRIPRMGLFCRETGRPGNRACPRSGERGYVAKFLTRVLANAATPPNPVAAFARTRVDD